MKRIVRNILLISLILLILFTSGCSYFELSTDDEILLGEQTAMEVESYYDLYRDQATVDRINRIGKEMSRFTTRPFLYKFRVLDSDEVNAFALPGGYIYIYRGLLDMGLNDDQLAAIIGHEITHIEADHFAQVYERMKRKELFYTIAILATGGAASTPVRVLSYLDAYIFEPKYSRENETECDMSSVQMMIQDGRNPHEFAELFKMWEKEKMDSSWLPGWMSDHPDFITRIRDVEEEISLQTKLLGKEGPNDNIFSHNKFNNKLNDYDIEKEVKLEDYLAINMEDDILNVKWAGKSDAIKQIECYGLNEKQRAIVNGRSEDSPFSVRLQGGKQIKYIIASVKFSNGDFLWDIVKI